MEISTQPGSRASTPETRLWAAVLRQAVDDLEHSDTRLDAKLWLESDDDEPGSFVFVATVLDVDPRRLRKRILQIDKANRRQYRYAA
ncbi:MAG: hypothetical protein HQL87_18705 [Magnetococcales bacterium]|nr:hypothetical protein [Magnetococcales bacterium]